MAVQFITIFKLLEPLRKGMYTIRFVITIKNIWKEKRLRIMVRSAISSIFTKHVSKRLFTIYGNMLLSDDLRFDTDE